jgi:hypothetical protein
VKFLSLKKLSVERIKWNDLVIEFTKLPKDIVKIIKDYTIVSPKQQFIDKCCEPQTFTFDCYKGGRIDNSCKHEIIGQYKLAEDDTLTIHHLPTRTCKRNMRWSTSWLATNISTTYCGKCHCFYSSINVSKDSQFSSGWSNGWMNNCCVKCSLIDFCLLAEKDDQICETNLECVVCEKFICSHVVHKNIFDKSSKSKKSVKILCIFCQEIFRNYSLKL